MQKCKQDLKIMPLKQTKNMQRYWVSHRVLPLHVLNRQETVESYLIVPQDSTVDGQVTMYEMFVFRQPHPLDKLWPPKVSPWFLSSVKLSKMLQRMLPLSQSNHQQAQLPKMTLLQLNNVNSG